MLVSGNHVFDPDTPVADCARLAALMEALCAGRLVWDKPGVCLWIMARAGALVPVRLCLQ